MGFNPTQALKGIPKLSPITVMALVTRTNSEDFYPNQARKSKMVP
jgi:hypothetical protein